MFSFYEFLYYFVLKIIFYGYLFAIDIFALFFKLILFFDNGKMYFYMMYYLLREYCMYDFKINLQIS